MSNCLISSEKYIWSKCIINTTNKMIHAFMAARMLYCNSLIHSISYYGNNRSPSIQDDAACILENTRKYDYISLAGY